MTSSLARAALLALALSWVSALSGCSSQEPCNGECPAGQHCDLDLLACVVDHTDGGGGCALDAECTQPGARRCLADRKRCVECLVGGDCASGQCDTQTFTCRAAAGCTRPQDCTDPGRPFCAADGRCVACRTQGDCQPQDGLRRACDLPRGTCVAAPCTKDEECLGDPNGSVCDTRSGACVGCTADSQCADRRCEPNAQRCVDCLADGDCDGSKAETCQPGTHTCKSTGCTEDAACAGAQRCDAGSHACVDCLADADCLFGGVCSAGRCVSPESCTSDAQCLLGGRCVEGSCRACASAGDCRTGQTCEAGACKEPASCAGEAKDSCLPGRSCQAGTCQPAACTADAFEPNDTVDRARALEPGTFNAVLCSSETDLYRVALGESEGLEVTVKHDAALGPVFLELVAAPGQPPLRVAGRSEKAGVVVATLESAPAGTGAALVRVVGPSGAAIPYQLTVQVGVFGLCADDGREPDNTQAQAPLVAPGTLGGTLCPSPSSTGEMDWVAVDVPAELRPEATLVLASGAPQVSLEIYTLVSGAVRQVAVDSTLSSTTKTTLKAAASTVAAPGGQRFWVGVRNRGIRKVAYTLKVELRPKPPANDLCDAATLLPPATTQQGHVRGALDDGGASCGGEGGADGFWKLVLTQPSQVTLDIVADFDAVLALADGTCAAPHELGCASGSGSTRKLSFTALPAGTYLVRVDSAAGQEGRYSLSATVQQAEAAPASETCELAQPLAFSSTGSAQAAGSLALAADDLTSSCGSPGGDTVYGFTLTEPKRLVATLAGFPGAALSLVSADDCSAMTSARCVAASGTENKALLDRPVVAAGEWRLVVDGGGALAGKYSLGVQLSEPIFPPANESCESTPLELGATQEGDTRGATHEFTPACGLPSAGDAPGDAVYQLVVDGQTQVTLELTASFDAALAVVSDPCDGGQPVACVNGRSPRLVLPALAAGTYWVWVDGYKDGQEGTYALTARRSPAVPSPTNDTCQSAQPVDLSSGSATVTGSTLRATDDLAPAQCKPQGSTQPLPLGGPDVAYEVTIPAGRTLKATLTPASDFDGALYVLDGCGQSSCQGASDASFLGGGVETVQVANTGTGSATWQVVVDSWNAQTAGDFSLTLELL